MERSDIEPISPDTEPPFPMHEIFQISYTGCKSHYIFCGQDCTPHPYFLISHYFNFTLHSGNKAGIRFLHFESLRISGALGTDFSTDLSFTGVICFNPNSKLSLVEALVYAESFSKKKSQNKFDQNTPLFLVCSAPFSNKGTLEEYEANQKKGQEFAANNGFVFCTYEEARYPKLVNKLIDCARDQEFASLKALTATKIFDAYDQAQREYRQNSMKPDGLFGSIISYCTSIKSPTEICEARRPKISIGNGCVNGLLSFLEGEGELNLSSLKCLVIKNLLPNTRIETEEQLKKTFSHLITELKKLSQLEVAPRAITFLLCMSAYTGVLEKIPQEINLTIVQMFWLVLKPEQVINEQKNQISLASCNG